MTIEQIISQHATEIAAIKTGLMNFDVPAQRTINHGFACMGIERFPCMKDDIWQMIVDHENGDRYERPPAHLIQRWASY